MTGVVAAPTERALRACAALGVDLETPALRSRPEPGESANRILRHLERDRSVCLIGASGAGKTTLLARVALEASGAGWRVLSAPASVANRAPIDLIGASPDQTMRLLCSCGLGDPACFARPADQLSAGQLERLRLALLMHEVERDVSLRRRTLVIVDELGASLDPLGARAIATTLARWARDKDVALLCATHRPEASADLGARHTLRVRTGASHRVVLDPIESGHGAPLSTEIAIEPGTRDDLRAMLPLHYRAGEPRALVRVLRATHTPTGEPLGVLGVAMPTLNGRWREIAWPGRFSGGDKRASALRLNREIRRLARTIVDPRVRCLGIARRLVESYLAEPLTQRTEAFSVHAHASGFHARAGMRLHRLAPEARHERLLEALEACALQAHELATPALALASARRPDFLLEELRRWARASRASRRLADAAPLDLLRGAARVALAPNPVAFTHP